MPFSELKQRLHTMAMVQFYVRILPNAPVTIYKNTLSDESIKIAVAAVAEKGKANAALITYIAQEFGVPKQNVHIISGATVRHKLVRITV